MSSVAKMAVTPIIDYKKIADGVKYYSRFGFTEIAVPWIISAESYSATKQHGNLKNRDFSTLDGFLNASGEQSFLELMISGAQLGRCLCVTSCFRDEKVDDIHHKYFVKVELIDMLVTNDNLKNIIDVCRDFFDMYFWCYQGVEVISTNYSDQSFDIVDRKFGIELGSYGIRRYRDFEWIYATGLAMPRLDYVLSLY